MPDMYAGTGPSSTELWGSADLSYRKRCIDEVAAIEH